MANESTKSYAHDAEVVVFNYQTRATEKSSLQGLSVLASGLEPEGADPMATTRISLREAITSIQVSKTKGQPQGTFVITLKPSQEWTKIIVPGSWCAIFMADRPLRQDDISSDAVKDTTTGNVLCPLKMLGIIMAVRVQKHRDANGATTLTYSITGYDYGYVFLSSIYINHTFQSDVSQGLIKGPFADINFPTDNTTYGNPAVNVQRILQGWSILSQSGVPGNLAAGIAPPSIRMIIPDDVADFFGTGNEVLQLVSSVIGVDQRDDKVVDVGDDGQSDDFTFKLIGEKFFMIWQLIINNTLWGMINQYLNPILNEAYCDLHAVENSDPDSLTAVAEGQTALALKPLLVVRQIPFNTPSYDKYWEDSAANAGTTSKFEVTQYVTLPSTTIPPEKVLGYDIGYSDYDRINFVEVNGFDKDLAKNSPGAFNDVNLPRFEEGSINRFGLRTKVIFGADYGAVRGNIAETGFWSPLLMDWWFNGNRFANGTIECIGLIEHIAIGENVILDNEKILGHIESYTHSFTVDENGNRLFRTQIDFVRGVSSDSTESQIKYIYGDAVFGGNFAIKVGGAAAKTQDKSIFQKDVDDRASFTPTRPIL